MPVLDIQIAASNRDAQETGSVVSITGGTNTNNLDATTDYVGLSFVVPDIASGNTITAAYLTVQPVTTSDDEPDVTIFCEAVDNSAIFTTAASSISSRTQTSNSVLWSNANLGATGTSDHNTPPLVTPVQDVINRAGWVAGNALTFLIQGSADIARDLTIKLWDGAGGAATAARLHLEYSAGQTARPTSDISAGTWTPSTGAVLWDMLNETTASDADYIQSAVLTATADVSEVALGSLTDPAVSTGHIVRYRYQKSAGLGDVVNLTVSLYQGATLIASATHSGISETTVIGTFTLSAAEADAITAYNQLRLRFSAVKG